MLCVFRSNNSFNSEAEAIAVDRKIQIDREKIDEHIKHLANRIAKQLRQETDYQEDVVRIYLIIIIFVYVLQIFSRIILNMSNTFSALCLEKRN